MSIDPATRPAVDVPGPGPDAAGPRPAARPGEPSGRPGEPPAPGRTAPAEPSVPLLRRVIGAVLRRIRLRQGRTLRDVARAAGVSLPYLSELERGRKEPSSEVLGSICRALGLRLTDLLDEAREELFRLESEARGRPGEPRRAGVGVGGRARPDGARGSYRRAAPLARPAPGAAGCRRRDAIPAVRVEVPLPRVGPIRRPTTLRTGLAARCHHELPAQRQLPVLR